MVQITALMLILALYALINLIAFFLYAHDKQKARNDGWRTTESTLLIVALLGPFGAYGAMRIFRHKTRKFIFYLVPVFLVLHLIVWGYLAFFILG